MQSMDEIYRAHSQTVYRYLLSQTRDTALSEDLMQETFCQAVRSSDRYDGSCKVSTWLCAIAKNLLLAYRRKNPGAEPLEAYLTDGDSTERSAIEGLSRIELLRLMHKLEPDVREIVHLRLLGDLSFREIGDVFGKTENWARVTYYRAKEKLKGELLDNE